MGGVSSTSSRGGRPHHSIPVILWVVALHSFSPSGQSYTMRHVEERILLTKVLEGRHVTVDVVLAGIRVYSTVNRTMQEEQVYRIIYPV